ncbi:MAG TPA: hypothetical protein VNT52_01055 [Acidimicrobiales bacterium]|nr:hypothetical protein [Acidimicrobiales bacterium]
MTLPPPPPPLELLPAGAQLVAGMGRATVLADMDFETYSEAGFCWNDGLQKWESPPGASQGKKGLGVVGAAVYAEHPSTEVLSLYYDLKDGRGRRHWRPGMAPPFDLFAHVSGGGLIEAWNVGFERWIWEKVCVPRYGWPPIPHAQYRCAMAKSRAHALPGSLDKAGAVLALTNQKDKDGDRLLKKFSQPRNPTKKDPRTRIRPDEDAEDGARLYAYNERDIVAEAEASSRCPDLEGEEFEFWLADQAINWRGVQIDVEGVRNCIEIIEQAHSRYNGELYQLTGGEVARASELAKLQAWFARYGVYLDSLDEEAVDEALKRPNLPPWAKRPLEIRKAVGSAAVKKVFAMNLQATRAGRLHDLFSYHAARTGRATGNGPQPTNLPNSGPDVMLCGCGRHFGKRHTVCPWCGVPQPPGKKPIEWGAPAVVDALAVIATRSLDMVEWFFHDAMAAVSGCLRGLFTSAPGHDLICADYSAIEAVVLAEVAGEEWRREVFKTHGKIYEMSASKITGIPFDEFMRHKKETGQHHPMRKKVGKVAELASGYQGWVGAWKAFGADEFFTEQEMKDAILAWRAASPAIVEFWGGQQRRTPAGWVPEMYGVEGMFVSAILNPGHTYRFRGFEFTMRGDAVYLRLLSGRYLTYHRPRLRPSDRGGLAISYEGWNTNPKNGPVGWIRMDTWGGRLTENIVQAVARDVLRHAIVNLERAGYGVVLHVYDEIVAEVPEGWGSVEEFERIMGAMPPWCADWPIKAAGGWRGKRYRKD